MTAGHLIADGDLTLLSDIADNAHIYACRELVAVVSREYLYVNDNAGFTVRHLKRIITNFSCLFAEDSTEEPFLCGKLGLALWSYLTNKDIAGVYL